jgi:hypothetical protein
MLSAALAAALVVGCSKEKDNGKPDGKEVKKENTGKSGGDSVTPAGAAAEVVGKGTGTLKGKVTFVGAMPEIKSEKDRMEQQGDKAHCLKGPDINEQTWKIDPKTKAVQYVVVWLRPVQKGGYFKLADADKSSNKVVQIDQPFCQFEPHVVAFYPSYFDGKKQVATAQKFEILNSAPMNHNTAWKGGNSANSGKNEIIKSKDKMVVDAQPSSGKKPGEDVIRINCDIHKWMNAFAWVFDHPYFAVTDKEGNYEIKNVPAGVEVEVVHWHETFDKPKAEKATLKAGENTKDFEIKK